MRFLQSFSPRATPTTNKTTRPATACSCSDASRPAVKPRPATASLSRPKHGYNTMKDAQPFVTTPKKLNRLDDVLCKQLHHCLRAYLIENFEEYLNSYETNKDKTYLYTTNALDKIARYRSLVIILRDVERINPEKDLVNSCLYEFKNSSKE
ncbi:hypothetical protein GEMRC1_008823 [Eukaryota sp. GEM-RC1]